MKDEYDFSSGKQGAISAAAQKTRITIRLDHDIIESFKQQVLDQGGGNYQNLINQALREHIQGKTMSEVLREAVHDAVVEELKAA